MDPPDAGDGRDGDGAVRTEEARLRKKESAEEQTSCEIHQSCLGWPGFENR